LLGGSRWWLHWQPSHPSWGTTRDLGVFAVIDASRLLGKDRRLPDGQAHD
jgi:hypothetical protein